MRAGGSGVTTMRSVAVATPTLWRQSPFTGASARTPPAPIQSVLPDANGPALPVRSPILVMFTTVPAAPPAAVTPSTRP